MTNLWDSRFEELLPGAVPLLAAGPNASHAGPSRGRDRLHGLVELLLQLEPPYGILVPDEALTKETFETPADLWRVVGALLSIDTPDRQ